MKLLLTNILLLIISISSWGQTDIGVGVVSINFDAKTILHFYHSPIDQRPIQTLEFYDDKNINSWNIKDLEKHQEWLKPEVLWLDYSSFNFRAKAAKDDWFEVIVNNETGKTYWLKKSGQTKFLPWQDYLKEMFSISRLPGQSQQIKESPSDSSKQIKYTGQDCFQIKSMKGDWIEIFTPEYCDEELTGTKSKIKSGWIKWRQGNKLLIDYSITS